MPYAWIKIFWDVSWILTFFLDQMEAKGAHALRDHVGKTPQDLIKRIITTDEHLSAATSFTNKQTANTAVLQNIRNNANAIEAWITSPVDPRRPNKAFEFTHDIPTGFGVAEKSKTVVHELTTSRVTIARDPLSVLGFRVDSAFPAI